MHVSGLAVPVRILAMVVSGGSVLRGFFVVVAISLLGRSAVLFHRCFRLRSRLVLLLAGWLFRFLYHGMSPEKRWSVPSFCRETKVDKPSLDVQAGELNSDLVTDLGSLLPGHQLSLDGGLQQPKPGSFFGCPGDQSVEDSPMRLDRNYAVADFRT
jgi:hypothetical protein